jgi:hypothetical protein
LEQGKDPLCIIRDPATQVIDFPQKSSMMQQKQADADYTLGFIATRKLEHAPSTSSGAPLGMRTIVQPPSS